MFLSIGRLQRNKIESFNLSREAILSKLKNWTNLKIGQIFEKLDKNWKNWKKIGKIGKKIEKLKIGQN